MDFFETKKMERKMENWKIFEKVKESVKKSDRSCFQNFLSNGILEKISDSADGYFFFTRGKLIITDDPELLKKNEEARIKKIGTYFFHDESGEKIISIIRNATGFYRSKIVEHHYRNEFDNKTATLPLRERISQMAIIGRQEKTEVVICFEKEVFFKVNIDKFYQMNPGFTM